MMDLDQAAPILWVLFLAVLAPVIADLFGKARVPVLVIEMILGILAGPDVLHLVSVTPTLETLSHYGLAFLFFLVGLELQLGRLWGRPLILATKGWGISLMTGLLIGFILKMADLVASPLFVGVALSTSALGILLPALRDAEEIETPFGILTVAAAAMGEIGPIVIISLALSSEGLGGPLDVLLIGAFIGALIGATLLALRVQPPQIIAILQKHMHTSGQLPIRLAILLLGLLLLLSNKLGLESILGALAAGVIVGLLSKEADDELRGRLESLGFGLFIPFFSIVTGIKFDMSGLLESGSALARIPLFMILFLIVRGAPLLLYREILDRHQWMPFAYASATTLPLVIAITDIGMNNGVMRSETAAGLIGAALLTVVLYPSLALQWLKKTSPEAT
jgi:Kef-type K+ transport system membrane component KefB